MKEYQAKIATSKDLPALLEFEEHCFEHVADRFPRRNLLHLINSSTSRTLLLIDDEGKVFGEIIGLLRHFKIPSGRIYKIGVRADMKKRGIGSLLIREMEKWFIESAMKKSCAEIRESNVASRTMFAKNGYLETGLRFFYYAGGENAVKCWKDLGQK